MSEDARSRFTATHYALLFAWISRAVVERVGEDAGEAAMKAFAGRYGEDVAEIVTAYREADFDRLPG